MRVKIKATGELNLMTALHESLEYFHFSHPKLFTGIVTTKSFFIFSECNKGVLRLTEGHLYIKPPLDY